MTSEIINMTLAGTASEYETVAEATERCLRAEEQFASGEIRSKVREEPKDREMSCRAWYERFLREHGLCDVKEEVEL